jgi:hypothetical protein
MSSPAILCSAEAIANAMAIVNNRFFIFIFVRLVRAGSIVVVVASFHRGREFPVLDGRRWDRLSIAGTLKRSGPRFTVFD